MDETEKSQIVDTMKPKDVETVDDAVAKGGDMKVNEKMSEATPILDEKESEQERYAPDTTAADTKVAGPTRDDGSDPATHAASEGIRHASISDDPTKSRPQAAAAAVSAPSESDSNTIPAQASAPPPPPDSIAAAQAIRDATPERKAEDTLEKVASPKKKRGRDDRDDEEEVVDTIDAEVSGGSSSPEGQTRRSVRNGPEKKRHRDDSQDPEKQKHTDDPQEPVKMVDAESVVSSKEESGKEVDAAEPLAKSDGGRDTAQKGTTTTTAENTETTNKSTPTTSTASADTFKKSAFGALSGSTTSPFGTVGANKPSVFASANKDATAKGFGAPSSGTSGFGAFGGGGATKSVFGGGGATTSTSSVFGGGGATSGMSVFGNANKPATGFGSLTSTSTLPSTSTSVFGQALGNGFASSGASKLTSFAASGKENAKAENKPSRAFGAPEVDDEEQGESGGEDEREASATAGEEDDTSKIPDEKRLKLAKVQVDTGESSEATLLSLRAKLFAIPSSSIGWKERGSGIIKVLVPKTNVDFYPNGTVMPMSYHFDEDAPPPRLVMRQENTLRVILNTQLHKKFEFKDKPTAKGAQVLFFAMEVPEGEEKARPVQMLIRMSEVNIRAFRDEVEAIVAELEQD